MRFFCTCVFFNVVLAIGCSSSVIAQAWTQPPGSAYLKVAHGRTAVSEQFDVNGDVAPFSETVVGDAFFDRSIYLYAEVGVIAGITAVGMIPIKNISVEQEDGRLQTVGVGDVELRARLDLRPLVGIADDATALAFSAGARLPSGYTRNLSPSVGSGQTDLQLGLALGRSFHPVPVYAQTGISFVNRLSMFGLSRAIDCTDVNDLACVDDVLPEFDNEWVYSVEVGVSIGSRLLLQLLASGTRSVNEPTEQFQEVNPIATRKRFFKVGSGVTLSITESVGTSLQIFRTTAGRNTIRSTDVFVGVEYRISGL